MVLSSGCFGGNLPGDRGILLRTTHRIHPRRTTGAGCLQPGKANDAIDVQKFEPCHLFINSEYWGVYNIREKINEFYFENNYNISTSGIDVLQGYSTVEVGDNHEYKDLLAYEL